MTEQILVWTFFLLLPWEITVTPIEFDKVEIRERVIQIEIETRAYRQKLSGRGL